MTYDFPRARMEHDKFSSQSLIRGQDESGRMPVRYYQPYEEQGFAIDPEDEETIDLRAYWRMLVKHRWLILTILLIILAGTAIATWNVTPIYRAGIKLQIDPEQSNLLPFKETAEIGSTYAQSQEYLQTQFRVLESRTLAERVILFLNLDQHPVFLQETGPTDQSTTMRWFRNLFAGNDETDKDPYAAEEQRLALMVSYFQQHLSTSPIRNSRLVDVYFESPDPVLAAEIVNTLAKEYIQMNFETKYKATSTASEFLGRQLVDLKAKVETAEEELVRFSQQHDIYALSDKENVIIQKLSDLNMALTAAQAERIGKESVWRIVQTASQDGYPEIVRNRVIEMLEQNLANLKVQQARLEASFNPGWPELDQVMGQVKQAEAQLEEEWRKAIRNAETEYRTAIQREELLTDALEAQKREATNFNQNSIQYNIVRRQVDTEKQLYEGLLQRMKEAGVSAGLKSNNIHVVDPAKPPRLPHKPNKKLNIALALAAGLIFGVGFAFVIEHLDRSIKSPDDVERLVNLPSLGMIPSAESLPSNRRGLLSISSAGKETKTTGDQKPVELMSFHDSRSLISEAYRNLRTSILLSSVSGQPPKALMVTSSHAGEGKTTTAINIAITLAQAGGKVILLDCDMRNPRVHRAMNLYATNGMSTYLSGNSDLLSTIQLSSVPNLWVIAAGRMPPNPAELLGSPKMKQGLSQLGEQYDHIVLDTPPVLAVTDARIIGTLVDGVILVIKAGETPKEAVQRTRKLLQDVHAHLIGAILNKVDMRSPDYAYQSRYYYYGYGQGAKDDNVEEESEMREGA
jgi:polysaccharide biosynthesis transport protein